jgi:hypothetical protein
MSGKKFSSGKRQSPWFRAVLRAPLFQQGCDAQISFKEKGLKGKRMPEKQSEEPW